MMSAHHTPEIDPILAPAKLKKGLGIAAICALVGLGATGYGYTLDAESAAPLKQFYASWLLAFSFFTTIALGALFYVILHHITRASWSTALRRVAENLSANLPWMAIAFVPVVLGLHTLYHWTHADAVATDPFLKAKAPYLEESFFLIRAGVFFFIWTLIALTYRALSVKQDKTGDEKHSFTLRKLAPVSMILFALTLTFAAFDWLMSLDPHWFSTIFGLYVFSGSVVSFFAVLSLVALWFTQDGSKLGVTIGNIHDSGKLMFGFIVFWTYIAFSQYFLIWYANIPEETIWYQIRLSHGWQNVSLLLMVGHFILPFFLLMSRHAKRSRLVLGIGAAWMLFMHAVDLTFIIMPSLYSHELHMHWLDLSALVGLGGFFAFLFLLRFRKTAAVPHKDPQFQASLEYDNA